MNLFNALKDLRRLAKKQNKIKTKLRQSTTWMKYHSIIYSLNRFQSNETSIKEECHQKKYDNLMKEEGLRDVIQLDPNRIITNLTNIDLSNHEILNERL